MLLIGYLRLRARLRDYTEKVTGGMESVYNIKTRAGWEELIERPRIQVRPRTYYAARVHARELWGRMSGVCFRCGFRPLIQACKKEALEKYYHAAVLGLPGTRCSGLKLLLFLNAR